MLHGIVDGVIEYLFWILKVSTNVLVSLFVFELRMGYGNSSSFSVTTWRSSLAVGTKCNKAFVTCG